MARVSGREQATVEFLLAQLRRDLPTQPRRRGAVEIFLHRRARDPHAARYRCIAQPQPLFEAKHFLDPPHRHPRSRHPVPPKGATLDAITCRSEAMQKPTRGAKNAEIRCRIGAKSPAAFRRNHLPLSTEIRCRFAPIFAMEERQQAEAALRQAQRMEAIGQLTGGIAHDFNNLLMIVSGNAALLNDTSRDDTVRRRASAIQQAADRGARLTRQLLAFSRRQALRPEPVDLRQRESEITEMLSRSL